MVHTDLYTRFALRSFEEAHTLDDARPFSGYNLLNYTFEGRIVNLLLGASNPAILIESGCPLSSSTPCEMTAPRRQVSHINVRERKWR